MSLERIVIDLYAAIGLMFSSHTGYGIDALKMGIDRIETSALTQAAPDQPSPPAIQYGVYDPAATFDGAKGFQIEHAFIAWAPLDLDGLARKARHAEAGGRDFMVTVEPWPTKAKWAKGGNVLLREVAQGVYDQPLERICKVLSQVKGHTLLRWGHEMEVPSDRYPWADKSPEAFIAAFRHVVDHCRKISPTTKIVWSPRGDGNLRKYYPGNAYVDMIGVSLWGLQKWDRKHGSKDRGFREVLWETYRNVVAYAKPVIISELGIAGDSNYVQRWLGEITDSDTISAKFPLLRTVVYFNDKEPHSWPDGFGSPDWRISPSRLAGLPRVGS